MRSLKLAPLLSLAVLLVGASTVIAKGPIEATVGPIDPEAGEPTQFTVQLSMEGHELEDVGGAVVFFRRSGSTERIEVPLTWEREAGTYVGTVTLPAEGRYLISGELRPEPGMSGMPFATIAGTTSVTVPASGALQAGASVAWPALLVALAALALLAGLAVRRGVLRPQRPVTANR